MRSIVTQVAWSVCLSVCWIRASALQKRKNRVRCRLGCGLVGDQGTVYWVGARIPMHGKGTHGWGNTGARSVLPAVDIPNFMKIFLSPE